MNNGIEQLYQGSVALNDGTGQLITAGNAISKGFDDIKGIRDTKHSALYNAFKYLYPTHNIPELFKLLSAWDSWSYDAEGIDFDLCKYIC